VGVTALDEHDVAELVRLGGQLRELVAAHRPAASRIPG
jgi:hypothetical protein